MKNMDTQFCWKSRRLGISGDEFNTTPIYMRAIRDRSQNAPVNVSLQKLGLMARVTLDICSNQRPAPTRKGFLSGSCVSPADVRCPFSV